MNAALFALALSLAQPGDAELAEAARRDYRAGCELRDDSAAARPHFASAAVQYRELRDRGDKSPELALNWARAEFLSGELPSAIAAAHAGLRIAPHHAGLQRDLEAYRDAVVIPPNAKADERLRPPRIAGVRARISAWDLFGMACVGAALFAVGAFRRFTTRASWAAPVLLTGFAILLLCGGMARKRSVEMEDDRAAPVLVLRTDEILRKGNGDSYPPRVESPLPRGAEVRELARRGGWIQVRLAGGAVGWLPERALLPVP